MSNENKIRPSQWYDATECVPVDESEVEAETDGGDLIYTSYQNEEWQVGGAI